jgi:dTMP kinase
VKGLFITFEGTEGSGKSTQIRLLVDRLTPLKRQFRLLREPGGTPIGEEIRHTLQHSAQNHLMTPEAELLLMNASRAQLVREVIRPALEAGEIVICDRFYDSTTAYQGYGRGLDLTLVQSVINFAVGHTRPNKTLYLDIPVNVSEARRAQRQIGQTQSRDRIEEAGRAFFQRVEEGYRAIARAEPERVKLIDAGVEVPVVAQAIWRAVEPLVEQSLH